MPCSACVSAPSTDFIMSSKESSSTLRLSRDTPVAESALSWLMLAFSLTVRTVCESVSLVFSIRTPTSCRTSAVSSVSWSEKSRRPSASALVWLDSHDDHDISTGWVRP